MGPARGSPLLSRVGAPFLLLVLVETGSTLGIACLRLFVDFVAATIDGELSCIGLGIDGGTEESGVDSADDDRLDDRLGGIVTVDVEVGFALNERRGVGVWTVLAGVPVFCNFLLGAIRITSSTGSLVINTGTSPTFMFLLAASSTGLMGDFIFAAPLAISAMCVS